MPAKKRTLEESILEILNDCKTPRTLHFIKDKYNFSHQKLLSVLAALKVVGYLEVKVVSGDSRGTKSITTTELGKAILIQSGRKY